MENDIIIISDHIEIHPDPGGEYYSVVRDGSVYGSCYPLEFARTLAEELAAQEVKHHDSKR